MIKNVDMKKGGHFQISKMFQYLWQENWFCLSGIAV